MIAFVAKAHGCEQLVLLRYPIATDWNAKSSTLVDIILSRHSACK